MSCIRLISGLSAIALAACATPSQPASAGDKATGVVVQPGLEFQLRVGESARISGTSSRVILRSVADDSRCPADVQCVWAGSARILLTILTEGSPDSAISINTGMEPRTAVISGYQLRLAGVSPEPRAGIAIPANSYVVRFTLATI